MPSTAEQQDTALDTGVAQNRIARVYAESLLFAANESQQVDSVGAELGEFVRGVLDQDPTIESFLSSPAVGRRAKTQAIEQCLEGRASNLLRNLIGVLNKNNRLSLIRSIDAAYRDLLDQRAGRVRVKVASAVPLTADQQQRLTQTLATRLAKTPVLTLSVDPSLLGGMVVRVGDKVFDTSVRTRLDTLRTLLLDQGSTYVRNQNQG